MNRVVQWPSQGGSSLLLAILAPDSATSLDELERGLVAVAKEYDVAVLRGLHHVVSAVRPGVSCLPWVHSNAVFVFRCPADLPVNEAMPLLCLAAPETPKELTALGVRLLEEFARLALQASAKVAFIAAHDWEPGDPVRFEAGFLGDFLRFVATSDAWTTKYLGQGKAYLSNTSHESPFWYEVRRDT